MRGEALRIDRGRGDDHFEVGAARQELGEVADEEVDVEAALVRLVEDQRVVAAQQPVALDLGEQDAVGHQLDQRALADLIGEPDGVADDVTQRGMQLVGDALCHGARCQPARLGVPDRAADPAPELEADLRQLGGLARSGLARDHDDLVLRDGRGKIVTPRAHRQVGIADGRHRGPPVGDDQLARVDLPCDGREVLRAAGLAQPFGQPRFVRQGQSGEPRMQFGGRRSGHSAKTMSCRVGI